MDFKQEDILDVEFDPGLFLSYEFDKLSMESIKKDIFEELPDENASDDKPDISSYLLTESNETLIAEDLDINPDSMHTTINIKVKNEELYKSEIKAELRKAKKDINGNEEIAALQNLNEQLIKLELSDSGNEDEFKEIERLRERAPVRSRKQSSKHQKKNLCSRRKEYDKTQFSSEKLRHLSSGSLQVETDNLYSAGPSNAPNYISYDNGSLLSTNTESSGYTFSNNDACYEESKANSLSSPESGYETSSISGGSPPPPFSTPVVNPSDLSLEDLNYIDDIECYIPSAFNPLSCIDEKDHKSILYNYFKDNSDLPNDIFDTNSSCTNKISISESNQADLNETDDCFLLPSSQVQPRSETGERDYENESYFLTKIEECCSIQYVDKIPVPINNVDLNNISNVETSPLSNNIQQRVDTPQRILSKPLEMKAKDEFRKILSDDKIRALEEQILKKVLEDKINGRDVNVIYITDENDGTSENRTNLHMAVLNLKLEEIMTLVEFHKIFNEDKPFNVLNNRDKYGKTALDYAIQKNMPLVVEYLKENMVCQGVNI